MALGALLFDLDGTLIDSNELHVEAWRKAFEASDYRVAADRIRLEIGKGGDHLVADVLGDEAESSHGDPLRRAHGEEFAKLARRHEIGVAPGALELLDALRRREIKLALATSAKVDEIEEVERSSGVRWRDLFDVVIDSSKAASSKPAPDIVRAALDELAMTPAECALVGDSPWDAHAATRAGVAVLGVTFGGNTRETLFGAGARLVYRDPADVHRDLSAALERLSPGPARRDHAFLERLMNAALAEARAGLAEGEAIGAVVARGNGEIVGRAHHITDAARSLEHAEIEALRSALSAGADLTGGDALLVSTRAPCLMCLGALVELSFEAIVFGLASAADDAGWRRIQSREDGQLQVPRLIAGFCR